MFEVGDVINDRVICLKALVGSHNYNLNTPSSDRDYKYFVYPTMDDLYDGKQYHKQVVTETEDYTIHDIRKLPMMIWKANVNFIEIMYSKDLTGLNDIDDYLFENAERFSLMNLHQLYNAAVGMFCTKRKQAYNDSPGRHESFEKYGYDTKSACHAIRLIYFLKRLSANLDIVVPNPVQRAFYYTNDDPEREKLLSIKRGDLSKEDITILMDNLYEWITGENILKQKFQKDPETTTYEELKRFIKESVLRHLKVRLENQ